MWGDPSWHRIDTLSLARAPLPSSQVRPRRPLEQPGCVRPPLRAAGPSDAIVRTKLQQAAAREPALEPGRASSGDPRLELLRQFLHGPVLIITIAMGHSYVNLGTLDCSRHARLFALRWRRSGRTLRCDGAVCSHARSRAHRLLSRPPFRPPQARSTPGSRPRWAGGLPPRS